METIIEVENLCKYYRVHRKDPGLRGSLKALFKREYFDVKAVDNISFEIKEGELVGFIGPNGAGKTTTLKVLAGLLFPTSGKARVLGFEPFKRQPKFQRQFALVMGQKNQLWWDIPAWESFVLNKEIYGVSDKDFTDIVGELTKILEIEDVLKVQVRKLSLGQRMKAELVAALLHSPKVVFLDEPTIGLDVVAQKKLRDFVKDYNQKYQATIILTSHYMEDVKQLCQRVIIIDQGKILYDGRLDEIVEKFAPYRVIKVDFEKKVDQDKLMDVGEVSSFDGVHALIQVLRKEAPGKAALLLNQFPVADLTIEEPPIEQIIREVFSSSKI